MPINIAIDGPAGAGKSTIAKAVAKALGILYLDTGAMYRALALKAQRRDVSPGDEGAVIPLLAQTEIYAQSIAGAQHTYLDGEDVSGLIRTQQISQGASDISAIPAVRIKLAEAQRAVARQNDVVLDGREIGSYVLPEAPYKFYITASPKTRAQRRLRELQAKGECIDISLAQMEERISLRDYNDSTRSFAPLVRVTEAIYIDTTDMNVEEAVAAVLAYLPKGLGKGK